MLLLGSFLSALFIPFSYLSSTNRMIGLWAFLGLGNLALLRFHDNYFSVNNDYDPYAHTWSLGVEEQYYVIFPIILFWILRSKNLKPFTRWAVYGLLPTLLLLSFAYSIGETASDHEGAYFLLPSRFWELAAGALLCLAHAKRLLLPPTALQADIAVVAGLVILLLSDLAASPAYFPFPWALAPVLGAVLCIAGTVVPHAAGAGVRILGFPIVVGIGRISYSLYLWHWVVIVLMRWTVGLESFGSNLLALFLTFSLSIISYFCLETQLWWLRFPFREPKGWAVPTALWMMLFIPSVFFILSTGRIQHFIGLSVVSRNYFDWYPDKGEGAGSSGKHWSDKRLFSVGDSHAWAYEGLFQTLRERDGVSVYVFQVPGTAACSLVRPESPADAANERRILEDLRKDSRPGDVVFLASLRVQRLCEEWEDLTPEQLAISAAAQTEQNRLKAIQEGERFIDELEQLKLRVIIEAPLPVFKAPPFRGSDWFNRMNPIARPGYTVARDFTLTHRASAMKSIEEVQTHFKDVDVWDPLPTLYSGPIYSAFEGTRPLFFDGDHLSGYGGRKLYPSFEAELEKIWK